MLGSPGRRRRLIQAFAPTSNAEKYYTSVPSSSFSGPSFRRRRTQTKSGDARKRPNNASNTKSKTTISTGFRPIDPMADHGYRINVARDGSMITAVPIDKQPLRGGGGEFKAQQRLPRASPILFSQPRTSPNASVNGSTAWSQQGLLDARGKQRHKMKRMRPVAAKTNNTTTTKQSPKILSDHDAFPNDPFNNVVHTAKDKLKQAKGFLAFTGTNNNISAQHPRPRQESGKPPSQPQPPPKSRSRAKATKVRWDLPPKRQRQPQQRPLPQSLQVQTARSNNFDDADASFSSFPILSPGHKFDDSIDHREEEKKSSNNNTNGSKNNNNAKKKMSHNDTNTNMIFKQEGDSQSFEASLQKRKAEIQSQQKEIADKISKKDIIKGTLITAIEGNLERNRKQMMALEEELKEIQSHLKLDPKKKQRHQITNIVSRKREGDVAARLASSPSGAFDMESVAGDPSITADTDSVAALFRKDKAGRVIVRRLDPPARPSPPTIAEELHPLYRRERKEPDGCERKDPDGPRISAVRRGNSAYANRNSDRLVEPPMRIPSPPTVPSTERPPLQHHQHYQVPGQSRHPWQKKKSIPPQSQRQRGKFVHFNLPHDSDSAELKFMSTNSTDSPSTDFVGVTNGDGEEDISWQEEHLDVDAYNEETGSVISSQHHDTYQWTDKEHHVVMSEQYYREDHHRRHHHGGTDEIESSPVSTNHNNYNGNRGVSSDSVETDPDLGFIHNIAAVVIQTAVRRFLAEITVEERLYAVNVIQATICNWMAHKRNPYFNSGEIFHDDQSSDRIFHDEQQNHPISFGREPPQRTKRVMFEDDYNDVLDFSAIEIQRCYRGWWARDGIEVDHFAATTIQRIFRGWWAKEALDVDRYCAVEVQRIVRGHLSRMSYIYDLYCIIVVQSVVRRYLAFYTSAVRLANILYIQAIFRGYRVRAELMRYVRNGQEVAATFIQSQWRSYDTHMNYINTLADILIVQSVARRWLTLRKVRRRMEMKPKYDNMGYAEAHANYNRSNTHVKWQQHRLNVVSSSRPPPPNPPAMVAQYSMNTEEYDVFHRDTAGGEEWYDGNTSETSDMLQSWKGRKSK